MHPLRIELISIRLLALFNNKQREASSNFKIIKTMKNLKKKMKNKQIEIKRIQVRRQISEMQIAFFHKQEFREKWTLKPLYTTHEYEALMV